MSSQPFTFANFDDENGNPAGGFVKGEGLSIHWQNGPLGRCTCNQVPGHTPHLEGCERQEPNGAFVETVIDAAIQRIAYYNAGKFRCRENSLALTHLEEALHWLNHRTAAREARQVEGTHQP